MIEDNGSDELLGTPNGLVQQIEEAEDAYDSALGTVPSDDDPALQSHDGLFRAKLRSLAKIVDEKLQAKEIAQTGLNKAKAELDAAYEDLHKAAKDDEQFLPFEHPTEEGGEPSQAQPDKTTAAHEQDESWRAVPLEQALDGLSKGIFESFSKNDPPLEMLGDLADWCKDHALVDIPGIGKGKGEKVEESLMRFWERRNAAAQAAPVQYVAPEDQAIGSPAPEPDRAETTPWHAEGNPNDVQPDEPATVEETGSAAEHAAEGGYRLSNDPQRAGASAYAGRM